MMSEKWPPNSWPAGAYQYGSSDSNGSDGRGAPGGSVPVAREAQLAALVAASGHTDADAALILDELLKHGWTVRPL